MYRRHISWCTDSSWRGCDSESGHYSTGRYITSIHTHRSVLKKWPHLQLMPFYNQAGGVNYIPVSTDNPELWRIHCRYTGLLSYLWNRVWTLYGGPLSSRHDDNVPCAVCHVSTRPTVLMIPAWHNCPSGWTVEYYTGCLMSKHYTHSKATRVDSNPESISASSSDTNGGLFYHVEATCNGLPCPPYDPQKELTCAVCTKWYTWTLTCCVTVWANALL